MSKELPYFRWYPADAETDELYSSLNDLELGFYHRCLNKAWRNSGLPADLDELARVMRVTRRYLDRVWARVGRCFYVEGDRIYNRRQEEERSHAIARGESNKRVGNANAFKSRSDPERAENANAFRTRGDNERDANTNAQPLRLQREANDSQHAHARADSECVSVSVSESSEESRNREPQKTSNFHEWLKNWPRTGDVDSAARAWVSIDADKAGDLPFSCRDRYLESSEVTERNAVMDPAKFIFQQAKCGWSGRWPKPRARNHATAEITSRKATLTQLRELHDSQPFSRKDLEAMLKSQDENQRTFARKELESLGAA